MQAKHRTSHNRAEKTLDSVGTLCYTASHTVTLAQLAERGVVVLDVMGSSPICHPTKKHPCMGVFSLYWTADFDVFAPQH